MKSFQTRITVGFVFLLLSVCLGTAVYLGAKGSFEAKNTSMLSCADNPGSQTYTVVIASGRLSINDIHTRACDTLTIINTDDKLRLMAFGVHNHHQSYGDAAERTLTKGEQLTITLVQRGAYTFHDHLDDTVQGTFTVE